MKIIKDTTKSPIDWKKTPSVEVLDEKSQLCAATSCAKDMTIFI